MEVTIMKKLSVLLLTIIACCMLWACGKTATFNESEEETTTHKKNKAEYSTTAEDITESSERQTYSDSDYKTGITFDNISRNPKDYEGKYDQIRYSTPLTIVVQTGRNRHLNLKNSPMKKLFTEWTR